MISFVIHSRDILEQLQIGYACIRLPIGEKHCKEKRIPSRQLYLMLVVMCWAINTFFWQQKCCHLRNLVSGYHLALGAHHQLCRGKGCSLVRCLINIGPLLCSSTRPVPIPVRTPVPIPVPIPVLTPIDAVLISRQWMVRCPLTICKHLYCEETWVEVTFA